LNPQQTLLAFVKLLAIAYHVAWLVIFLMMNIYRAYKGAK